MENIHWNNDGIASVAASSWKIGSSDYSASSGGSNGDAGKWVATMTLN